MIFIAGAIATPLIALGALSAVHLIVDAMRNNPGTIEEQLADEIQAAARDNMRVQTNRLVDLRGVGRPSRVLILRPPWDDYLRSDELRIYEIDGDRLNLRLRFQPSAGSGQFKRTFWFEIFSVRDLDRNGAFEIIGSFSDLAMSYPFLRRPVIVQWDARTGEYAIAPLFPMPTSEEQGQASRYAPPGQAGTANPFLQPPGLAQLYEEGDFASGMRSAYIRPIRLIDRRTGRTFATYAVDDFFMTTGRYAEAQPVLVAAFTVKGVAHVSSPEVLQIRGWSLDVDDLPRRARFECLPEFRGPRLPRPVDQRILVRPRRGEGTDQAMRRTWATVRSRMGC